MVYKQSLVIVLLKPKKKKKDKQCITKKIIAKIKQNFFKWHFFFKVNWHK